MIRLAPALSWRSVRGRATLTFTAAAVALTAVGAVAVWAIVSQYLLAQREAATAAQTVANADRVQRSLRSEGLERARLLAQLPRELGSASVLTDGDESYTSALGTGADVVPAALRESVVQGRPMRQRVELAGETRLVVGVPLAGRDRAYFEIYPLEELDQTYRVLSTVLAVGVLDLGLAALVISWWVTGPVLRPLATIADAAGRLARGDLSARLEVGDDPELRPIAASFNAAAADLRRRVEADARFAADVSHELRNPLTTIVASVALLEAHRARLPAEGQETLELLEDEVQRFAALVDDLLEISRTDAAGEVVHLEPVCLARLVRHALPEHLRDRVVVDADAAEAVVPLDKRRVERIVTNLVDNAEHHGGGLVEVRVARRGTAVAVMVDDDGPGVPEEERARVFERFARGSAGGRGRGHGAGLGLSLVARHAALMGGVARAEERPGGGARFVLELLAGGGEAP